MKKSTEKILKTCMQRYKSLESCYMTIVMATEQMISCYKNGQKILLCGNGGSASDAEHIAGELMKSFLLKRSLPYELAACISEKFPQDAGYLLDHLQSGLPAISLGSMMPLSTAIINDQAGDVVFAQQLLGLGNAGDVLVAISTSGNSKNVLYAVKVAVAKEMKVIAFTGADGGILKNLSDVCICVPAVDTYKIQEYHLPVYHAICQAVENEFFGA